MNNNPPSEVPQPPQIPYRGVSPPTLGSLQEELPTEFLQAEWIRLHRKRTNWGVGLGLLVPFAGNLLAVFGAGVIGAIYFSGNPSSGAGGFPLLVVIFAFYPVLFYSLALFIWGCQGYAMSKGLPPSYGYLGFLSLIGLVILFLIPKKSPVIAPWRGYFRLPLFRISVSRSPQTD